MRSSEIVSAQRRAGEIAQKIPGRQLSEQSSTFAARFGSGWKAFQKAAETTENPAPAAR
jgi:hypothetical protein